MNQVSCEKQRMLFTAFNARNWFTGELNGDENILKRQIAITRRDELNHLPLRKNDESGLCFNCNVSILNEIAIIEADPTRLQLNVLNNLSFILNVLRQTNKSNLRHLLML